MHQIWQNSKPLIIFKALSKILLSKRTKNLCQYFKVKRKILKIFVLIFRATKGEGEKETSDVRKIDWLPVDPPTGDPAATHTCALT